MNVNCELYKDLHFGNAAKYLDGTANEAIIEQKLAILKLPTGKIVANDPLCLFEFEPFVKAVEPGEYPVYLFIYQMDDDKRVAFAEIRFSEKKPVQFELARRLVSSEKDDSEEAFMYGVDSGTGGFMDASVAAVLQEYDDKDADKYFNDVNALLEKSYVHTYDTADYIPRHTDSNVVMFSSGYGDGVYQSYFGYDEAGELCCLMTDFETMDLLEDIEEDAQEEELKKEGFLKKYTNKILGR